MARDEALARIHDPDPSLRREAARALRASALEDAHVLAQAAQVESDEPTRREFMETLGLSGADEAKPVLDRFVISATKFLDRYAAAHALRSWMVARKKIDPGDLPSGWPYGVPGYPPKD